MLTEMCIRFYITLPITPQWFVHVDTHLAILAANVERSFLFYFIDHQSFKVTGIVCTRCFNGVKSKTTGSGEFCEDKFDWSACLHRLRLQPEHCEWCLQHVVSHNAVVPGMVISSSKPPPLIQDSATLYDVFKHV